MRGKEGRSGSGISGINPSLTMSVQSRVWASALDSETSATLSRRLLMDACGGLMESRHVKTWV